MLTVRLFGVSMTGGQSRLTFNGENLESQTIGGGATYVTGDNISPEAG